MTKDKARKLVDKFIKKYKHKANIAHWTIDIKFVDEQKSNDEQYVLADIIPDEVYLNASICIYPAFLKANIRDQEKTIAHEVAHCLTNPLATICTDMLNGKLVTFREIEKENERLTEIIAILMTRDL